MPGFSVGWLQGDLLLQTALPSTPGGAIFNSAGIKQSGPALPNLSGPLQVLSATSIYDVGTNAIYSLSTGSKTWSTGAFVRGSGTVAGSEVVFPVYSNQLVAEPY